MKLPAFVCLGLAACASSAPAEIVVTAPPSSGIFAVYGVGGSVAPVARIVIPESRVAVVEADKIFDRWHTIRFEERSGVVVDDARFVRTSRDSKYRGVIHWFYRGSMSDQRLYLDDAGFFWRRNWLRGRGLLPDK